MFSTFSGCWHELYSRIHYTKHAQPFPGCITTVHKSKTPYPLINEVDLHLHALMDLLKGYVYPALKGVSKFTRNRRMRPSMSEEKEPRIERLDSFFQITIGSGIPLTEDGGLPIAKEWVYEDIYIQISRILAKYHGHEVIEVGIRAYMGKATANRLKYSPASVEDRERELE